jgi:hypothetical protein
VIRLIAALMIAASAFWLFNGAVVQAQAVDYCRGPHADWVMAQQAVRESMEAYRKVKDESVAPKIEQDLAAQTRGSTARTVQEVLRDRKQAMDEAARKVKSLLEDEKLAFSRWLRCANEGRGRPAGPSRSNPEVRAREGLLAELNDLLTDEAYDQYKGQKGPAAAAYSGYDPRFGPEPQNRDRMVLDRSTGRSGGFGGDLRGYPSPAERFQGYFR